MIGKTIQFLFGFLSLLCLIALVWPVTVTTAFDKITPELGKAYVGHPQAPSPPISWAYRLPDALFGGSVQAFENGAALKNSAHLDTRDKGEGRYTSYGTAVFFSSSDNSDPRTNGRTYSALHELVPNAGLTAFSFFAFATFLCLPLLMGRVYPKNGPASAPPLPSPSPWADWFDWLALAMVAIAGGALFLHAVHRCNFGLGFQDESIFLAWIADPWADKYMFSLNGVLFHPLYLLVQGSIVLLRQVNMAITYILTAILIIAIFHGFAKKDALFGKKQFVSYVTISLSCAAVLASMFVHSPSYYHLAYQSMLVAAIGLLYADKSNTAVSIGGWITIGVSLYMAFMARMPSVFVLFGAAIIYLVLANKFEYRKAIVATAVSAILLVATIFILDGGILPFVARIAEVKSSFQGMAGADALTNILRIDNFYFNSGQRMFIAITALFTFSCTVFFLSPNPVLNAIAAISCSLTSVCLLLILSQKYLPDLSFIHYFTAPMTWGIVLGVVAAIPVRCRQEVRSGQECSISRSILFTMILLSILPYVSVFGTGQHQWSLMQPETSFWVLAALVPLAAWASSMPKHGWRTLLPVVAIAQLVVFTTNAMDRNAPWPAKENSVEVTFPSTGARIYLDPLKAAYLNEFSEIAARAAFAPNTPFINLTGNYRVAQVFLGARSLGSITVGEQGPHSTARTHSLLDKVPLSDLKKAWILVQPDGSMSASPSLLHRYGIDVNRYVTVGSVTTPVNLPYGGHVQYLLKPPAESDAN